MKIYLKKFKTWKGFSEAIAEFRKDKPKDNQNDWIFRGQKRKKSLNRLSVELKTSLECACEYFPRELRGDRKEAEVRLLREFKRRYHQYSSNVPKAEDCLEWFSIMQHYGAPTRLLDFTYSIDVATNFAIEYCLGKLKDNSFEIIAINPIWARDESASQFSKNGRLDRFLTERIGDDSSSDFKDAFMADVAKPAKFVCPINPFSLMSA